jgi:hypothetical protein
MVAEPPGLQATVESRTAPRVLVPASVPAESAAPRTTRAAEERATLLRKLEDGGAGDAPWTVEARGVFDHWRIRGDRGRQAPVEFTPARCYRQGCTVTIRYADQTVFDRHGRQLSETEVFKQWKGVKWKSGPVVTTDGVEATWILFPPLPDGGGSSAAR